MQIYYIGDMVRGLNRALRAAAKSGTSRPSKDDASVAVDPSEPRSFPQHVKEACWNKAALINGRDPARWRRDHLGNIVFRKLVACPGCLCYEFDHIIPYSKGGRSNLENCQVLQSSANRAKGNKLDTSMTELIQGSAYCRLSGCSCILDRSILKKSTAYFYAEVTLTLALLQTNLGLMVHFLQSYCPDAYIIFTAYHITSLGKDMDIIELSAYGDIHYEGKRVFCLDIFRSGFPSKP